MSAPVGKAFKNSAALDKWLEKHHADKTELWVRLYKKGSGTPSVDWQDCVVAALAWGWIDGHKKSLDENSFLQRLSPRRPKSNWSKKNVEHAERLIAEGKMQPAGLAHIEAARADGRWDAAYAGSSELTIPADFLAAVNKNPKARAKFETLNRAALFAIYYRLHSAKRPATRAKRFEAMLARLAKGEQPV